ncbi:hypothetical protein MASR1M50_28530 [Burkholderiales bacterium]
MASHAGTLLVGQLAVMGFAVVDTVVAGRHSNLSLAALSVGAAVFITVNVSLMGLLSGLLPIWAELHGARKLAAIGSSARQALYLCAMASLLGMAVLFNSGPLLRWTAVPTDLRPVAAQYLAVVGWSLPAALLFRAFSTLNQALGRPQLVSWLQVLALAVKLPLSVWLTFGGAGVPALGVVGCAWATFVVNVLLCVLALGLLRTQSLYAPLRLWQRIERPHGPTLAAFARLGVPAGLTVGVEITSFTLMALFVARLGTTATAAHQIAANVTSLMYMLPLSLAVATSARVGWWRGAGDEARARTVALQGFWLAAGVGDCAGSYRFCCKTVDCGCLFGACRRGGAGCRPAGLGGLAARGRRHADRGHLRAALLSGDPGAAAGVRRAAVGPGAGGRLPAGVPGHRATGGAAVAGGVLAGGRRCPAADGAGGAVHAAPCQPARGAGRIAARLISCGSPRAG